jgi:hypothetical protein
MKKKIILGALAVFALTFMLWPAERVRSGYPHCEGLPITEDRYCQISTNSFFGGLKYLLNEFPNYEIAGSFNGYPYQDFSQEGYYDEFWVDAALIFSILMAAFSIPILYLILKKKSSNKKTK